MKRPPPGLHEDPRKIDVPSLAIFSVEEKRKKPGEFLDETEENGEEDTEYLDEVFEDDESEG